MNYNLTAMKYNFDSLLDKVTEFNRSETRTETILGNQFTLGDFICVPIMRFGINLRADDPREEQLKNNKGDDNNKEEDVGLGMMIEPLGFLVAKGDQINFLPTNTNKSENIDPALKSLSGIFKNNLYKEG